MHSRSLMWGPSAAGVASSAMFFSTSTSDAASPSERVSPEPRFELRVGAGMIPHPEKAEKGGEDAYFSSFDGNCFGVFDGVGGWAEMGVDAGLYSKALAELTKRAYIDALDSGAAIPPPEKLLEQAYNAMRGLVGSCTACVLLVQGDKLLSANLGDSGFMVIRDSQVFYRTIEQQHQFNFPFQLGSQSDDKPSHADTHVLTLKEGDFCVAATDGVFDNLYDHEILHIVCAMREEGATANEIAAQLVKSAFDKGSATEGVKTPFRDGVAKQGYLFEGGKLDDNTVVCVEFTELAVPSTPPSKL